MSCRRVEVLVRAGEVVVVLDSAEELRGLLDRMPGEAVEARPETPKAAAGSTAEDAGAQVCVQAAVWHRMQRVVSDAEGVLRGLLSGAVVDRREIRDWLEEVESVRRRWTVSERRQVSSQAAEA